MDYELQDIICRHDSDRRVHIFRGGHRQGHRPGRDRLYRRAYGAGRRDARRRVENASYAAKLVVERSEEHTSELQSLMRISYAVFCLKKKKIRVNITVKHAHSKI